MIETLKKFGGKKLGGLILIVVIIIAFGFGGFGGGFSTNNQNNIAKINKTNVTTQDFMNYLNESGISQQAIRENLDNNIIEELLSGLISSTLIDLEVEDFDLSITQLTVLKKIKENKNFQDENNIFQRTKYEKFLLSNNMSAPMFELQLKNRELQKHLFDFIGAGTITPDFLTKKKFEEENKSLDLEYFAMENFYKEKESYTETEVNKFLDGLITIFLLFAIMLILKESCLYLLIILRSSDPILPAPRINKLGISALGLKKLECNKSSKLINFKLIVHITNERTTFLLKQKEFANGYITGCPVSRSTPHYSQRSRQENLYRFLGGRAGHAIHF